MYRSTSIANRTTSVPTSNIQAAPVQISAPRNLLRRIGNVYRDNMEDSAGLTLVMIVGGYIGILEGVWGKNLANIEVGLAAIGAGIALPSWFKAGVEKVYDFFSERKAPA